MVDSTDHVTPKTGLTPTVTLSKAGGSFASPSGSVSEIGNGWYKVAGNATDTNTLGALILHATGTAADPTDIYYDVVSFNPQDSVRLGLTSIPNAVAGADTGLPVLSNGASTLGYAINSVANAVSVVGTVDANIVSVTDGAINGASFSGGVFPDNFAALDINPFGVIGGVTEVGTVIEVDSFGNDALTQITAIGAKTSQLQFTVDGVVADADVTVDTSGIAAAVWSNTTRTLTAGIIHVATAHQVGRFEIVRGGSYDDTNPLTFTKGSDFSWPTSLSSWTLTLTIKPTGDTLRDIPSAATLSVTGTAASDTSVTVQVTKTQTSTLSIGRGYAAYEYTLLATMSGDKARLLESGIVDMFDDLVTA